MNGGPESLRADRRRTARSGGWIAIALALTLRPALGATPGAPAALFARGNAAYQEGDYAAAEASYRGILAAGIDSVPVYYNLANACFKQKKLGEAVYYWQTALRRAPRDPDILGNLDFAALYAVDRIEAPAEPWLVRTWGAAVNLVPPRLESWLLFAAFLGANALFGWYVIARSPRTALAALVGAAAMLSAALALGVSLGWKEWQRHRHREAVIVESRADARSGPGDENVTVFSIHEGTIVRLRSAVPGWQQISLPNGWNGWVRSPALREIR